LQKETLDLNDIVSILGPRPFEPKDNFKAYISIKESDEE
jgi:AFG3 family protein